MTAQQIKALRGALGLTQAGLAARLGVSFVTVSRWESGAVRPSVLALRKLTELERSADSAEGDAERTTGHEVSAPLPADFSANPEDVRLVVEAERLSHGYLFNPAFATEISLIDPLPHQRIAVYRHLLSQPRLRFLLADDAGAGKTIMAGLYIREMLARRLIRRVLVVPPAGLVGNWRRELRRLFSLHFSLVRGSDVRARNPFAGEDSDLAIVSLDTLTGSRVWDRLRDIATQPYDLVIFDEAHKLSARRDPDGTFRPTDRYRAAEVLAGVPDLPSEWTLPWAAHHLLLLTATPHMGKSYPYFCLWRLLEPHLLSTEAAFAAFPQEERAKRFLRRVKEEMVYFDARPIYPQRISDTLSYDLKAGPESEQELYDRTSAYIEHYYNQARILNRTAARFAICVFQRRLASSTNALLCSLRKRLAKLTSLIERLRSGELTEDELRRQQTRLDRELVDPLEEGTSDEEGEPVDDLEPHEPAEDNLLQGVIAVSLAQVEIERQRVLDLVALAQRVEASGQESKFDRLREVLRDPRFIREKVIIFTEHRDTQTFLARRLEGLGLTGQIAQINGGMDFIEREAQVEHFRRPLAQGGAQYLICTDAAGEGINLQFAWLMVNYDIPWNPARLEQRMGRIHRYGQKHDPVIIVNLVAGKTREGRVLAVLLEKLEAIRRELRSDKVFDVVGRLFEGVSLREYMERITESEAAAADVLEELNGRLTKEQIDAIAATEARVYGSGGDVLSQLEDMKAGLATEELRRLLPGYVFRFIRNAAAPLGFEIDGDLNATFALRPGRAGALDQILPNLEEYPEALRRRLSVFRPEPDSAAIFIHPGEPIFESIRTRVLSLLGPRAERGATFVDPTANSPYLFYCFVLTIIRRSDLEIPRLRRSETLEQRLFAVRATTDLSIEQVPVEQLLLLRGASNEPKPSAALALLAMSAEVQRRVDRYAREVVGLSAIEAQRAVLSSSRESKEKFLRQAFDYQSAELASRRLALFQKARNGDSRSATELDVIRQRQRELLASFDHAIAELAREPQLVDIGAVSLLARAIVIPSSREEDQRYRDDAIEAIAVEVVMAHERALGCIPKDVSTAERARAEGLMDYPGFDILSKQPDGTERCIEVKGRAAVGAVELSENEWVKALNLRTKYWLYVVFDCGSPRPNLYRIRDPFRELVVKARGGVRIESAEILTAALRTNDSDARGSS